MKKIWSKKRFQRAGHSSWMLGRLTHDSDNTDDENGESQVSMETKERSRVLQSQAASSQMSGGGKALVAPLLGPCDGPVVEREMHTLGSRAPGPQDSLQPARSHLCNCTGGASPVIHTQPSQNAQSPVSASVFTSTVDSTTAHNGSKKPEEEAELPDKARPSLSTILPQSSGSQDPVALVALKLPRTAPKIYDKVRAFEQRRHSVDALDVPAKGVARTGVGQRASCHVEDGATDGSGSGSKRAVFKQRASSLEDRPSYTQKVQCFQSRFSEELQRIKKHAGRPNIQKAFSTERLTVTDERPAGKVQPILPEVIAKFRNAFEKKGNIAEVSQELAMKEQSSQTKAKLLSEAPPAGSGLRIDCRAQSPDRPERPLMKDSQPSRLVEEIVPEAPGQRSLCLAGKTLGARQLASPGKAQPSPHVEQREKKQKNTRPEPKAVGPLPEDAVGPAPPKPPRLLATASTFPRSWKERGEKTVPPHPPGLTVPALPPEDETPEDGEPLTGRRHQKSPKQKEERRRGGRSYVWQTTAEEEEDSLDDPYISAEEVPAGGPVFRLPLKDVVAVAGSDVTLECVIVGKSSQVTWRKGGARLSAGAGCEMKTEGGRHSLRISLMRPCDAGTYSITAAGDGGQTVSCSATLFIQSEPVRVQGCPLTSTLAASDVEFLGHMEEATDFGALSRTGAIRFKEPPAFQVALSDQAAREGEDVTMCVQAWGQPKPMVCWLKDRMNFRTDGQHELREMDNGKYELKIKSAGKIDGGIYTCKIINEYGTKQSECRLEVKDLPPPELLTITSPLQDVRVCAGKTALFECHVSGPQDADVDWLANGKLMQPALLDCKMHFDGKRCCLLLRSVHEDDSGFYTCKVSTAKEEVTSSAQLTVTPSEEPLFTRKLEALEVMEGRSAHFDCKVSGTPPPEVTWNHCDQPVVESENIHILTEGGHHSLHLSHVTLESEGSYVATARNAHGWAESSAELYVQEPRQVVSSQMSRLEKMPSIPEEPEGLEGDLERRIMPDFLKPLSDLEVLEGREAMLVCKVAGTPYPTITWYHNGQKIDSTYDRKMTQYRDVHSLVIRSVCHAHSGVYKSVISNKVGKATCYAHLYVTDIVPEPPEGPPVVESITGRSITISWKKPKNLDPSIDPGCLMYAVQQQALGSIQWTIVASSLSETSYTVTALSKGVRYAFRVLSTSGRTFSKPSPPTDLLMLIDRGQYLRKAPVILEKPDVVYAVENQPVTMTITLNHVQASVTWKRRGAALVNKPGAYEMYMPDDHQHALKISRVKGGDIGQLICMANNQYGSDLCTVLLATAAPPAFETIMEDLDVCVGETVCFTVVVGAKPDPDVLWYKDNILLVESCHFTFVYEGRESTLLISSVQPADSGVYTCIARNLAGEVSCKAELTVHTEKQVEEKGEHLEDKGAILRRMRRLTDYYDIHKEIGRGAFSYVKRVTQKNGKLEYAAKFISTRVKGKSAALREVELLSGVDHERILYFHDAFEKKNVVVIITELCREELLERLMKKTTILETEIRSCIWQILEGIMYLHQNDIIHLDIKPENILMADRRSDQIKICDFGNARKLTPNEAQYCTYGTPEYIAPEIVNQTPVSKATDIWPVGVITYLCLTGVSPFAGENDRHTLLNIRNSNIAFEESMFTECREAKGFVIKLLVTDRLRPDVAECLHHPWFNTLTKGKSINTSLHKHVLARSKWQRSLISYKSKMMMSSISELLNDSCSRVSLAVPRSVKEGSPPVSSSSDSDEDIDELPFVPMPLTMMFSGSRMSLNEIHEDDTVSVGAAKVPQRNLRENEESEHHVLSDGEDGMEERIEAADGTEQAELALRKDSSMEAEQASTKPRRRLMRRGSSADSALLLHITPMEGAASHMPLDEGQKSMKKAASMDLPQRSNSPSPGKPSQEDYALKLELLRHRLIRGGCMDKKLSGLRGPLFETLGMDEEKKSQTLDCNLRTLRLGGLACTSSADRPGESPPKTQAFRKSISLSQVETEPVSLRRRSGAPLEIPSAEAGQSKLHKESSVPAVPEQTKLEAPPELPIEHTEGVSSPNLEEQQVTGEEEKTREPLSPRLLQHNIKKIDKMEELRSPLPTNESHRLPEYSLSHDISSYDSSTVQPNAKYDPSGKHIPTSKISEQETSTEHLAVFASMSISSPTLRTDIKDIDSEEVFEARFKKRESSLTQSLKRLTKPRLEEKSPVLPRRTGEEVYRPGPTGAPLEFVSRGLQEKSKSFQDLREVDKDPGLGLIGRLSLRVKKNYKKEEMPNEENSDSSASRRRVTWALGRSKSLDKRAAETEDKHSERNCQEVEHKKVADSPVLAMRRRFESKVLGMSDRIHNKSQERKDSKVVQSEVSAELPKDEEIQDIQKVSDSPILAMRKKSESKFSDSLLNRSHSEERNIGKGAKDEGKRTPLLSRLRHSQFKSIGLKKMAVPENQLSSQTSCTASKESLDSTSSTQSTKSSQTHERDCRSRWDRWGLSRGKRDKTPSKPSSPSTPVEDQSAQQYTPSASDFPPVFHIKLKDHILLDGEPITLTCLPAGSPHPSTVWMKDKKLIETDDRMNMMASPDGRHLLMIINTSQKDAGLYECVATNNLGSATTSCILTLAHVPKCPGTPEIPQIYNNTALVVWKPAESKSPCTYTLERRSEGDPGWLVVAAGIADCYYNVTELPRASTFRFRVACVNKAGQGPYSSVSERVDISHIPAGTLPPPAGGPMTPVAPPPVAPPPVALPPHANTAAGTLAQPAVHSPSVPVSVVASVPASHGPLQTSAATAPWRKTATNTAPEPLSSSSDPQTALSPRSPTHVSPVPKDAKAWPNLTITTDPVVTVTQLPPKVRSIPPLVPAKPNSPINVVPPITQVQSVPQRSYTAPLSVGRLSSPLPNYIPATSVQTVPAPVAPVVLTNSISPIGDSAASHGTETPTGRVTPSTKSETILRQGVPQKPYTFLDERARGRFGVIRDCRENATGKMFMAKIVSYDQETKQTVMREYETLKSLHNEKIMALHEAYVTPRYLVLITEHCMGKEILYSLSDRFRYSEDDVAGYVVQILQGLDYLHSCRILHMDIRPDNIMVTRTNVIKILDFGSAQSFNPLSLQHYSRDLGTLEYMAPEMLKGDVVGPPADVWSLGVLTYVMLSGRLPFQEKDPQQTETKTHAAKFDPTRLYPNVSQSALAFLKKTLNGYPWSRPAAKDCIAHSWLQDSYLSKLRRQTLTFTTTRLKEFLAGQQRRRSESATRHKVLLRTYQGGPQSLASPSVPNPPSTPVSQCEPSTRAWAPPNQK